MMPMDTWFNADREPPAETSVAGGAPMIGESSGGIRIAADEHIVEKLARALSDHPSREATLAKLKAELAKVSRELRALEGCD